jgi:pimeloyl-ACP methyl ester carboxylesterase
MELQTPLMMMQAMRAMAERPDSTSDLLSYQFPVVVVHGNADALIPIERAREVHKVLPQSHFEELEGVGHLPMMESPHATAAALTKFG